ncbi:hypothetical protein ACP70R_010497 [Stipagrostis hirtigluma subsp. patula]
MAAAWRGGGVGRCAAGGAGVLVVVVALVWARGVLQTVRALLITRKEDADDFMDVNSSLPIDLEAKNGLL